MTQKPGLHPLVFSALPESVWKLKNKQWDVLLRAPDSRPLLDSVKQGLAFCLVVTLSP